MDNGVAVIHMGEINREDVIPQMAEFCLQIEGVEWGVVSGVVLSYQLGTNWHQRLPPE